jgi:hypothetical protein
MTRFFGGTDLSFESGLIVAGLIYYFLKRRDAPKV